MSARKKTPFQKHREEEEAKKKRALDETARLYQEFVESFQVDSTPGSKAFVRGGTINPNDKLKINSKEGRSSLERREKRDNSREASRKHQRSWSRSGSPLWKSSDRDQDSDWQKRRGRERKSGSRERDDHDRD